MPPPLDTFEQRQAYAKAMREVFSEQMRDLARQRMAGTIDDALWNARFRELLREQYGMMVVIGAGGNPQEVTPEDWLKAARQLKGQYDYLEGFNRDIREGKITTYEGRATLYARSSYQVFWEVAVPVQLPAQPGDCSTICCSNCACEWVIKYERNNRGRITAVLATWTLGAAEHCPDCVKRASKWNPLRIPVKRSFEPSPLFKAGVA